MQKKLIKSVIVIFIVMLFVLNINVRATEDIIARDGNSSVQPRTEDLSESNTVDNEFDSDVVDEQVSSTTGSTKPANQVDTGTSVYTPPTSSQPITSYSTVATIPEANLSLNNILNVILIAVGVIIILLAIAILIRLK